MTLITGETSLSSFLDHSKPVEETNSFPTVDIRSVSSPPLDLRREYQLVLPAILPQSIHNDLTTSNLNTFLLETREETSNGMKQTYQIEMTLGAQKLPGFTFSKYNYQQSPPTLLLSETSYSYLFTTENTTFPKDRLLIQLKGNLTEREYAYIADGTRSL